LLIFSSKHQSSQPGDSFTASTAVLPCPLHVRPPAALTEVLAPKLVYITTPTACQQQLQQLKSTTSFVAAFTSPGLQQQVDGLWQQLGRAGPPLFFKVRARSSLQDCEQQVSNRDCSLDCATFTAKSELQLLRAATG
jgi:hypothetical protein